MGEQKLLMAKLQFIQSNLSLSSLKGGVLLDLIEFNTSIIIFK